MSITSNTDVLSDNTDRFALFYRVGQVLNSTLDINEVLDRFMDMVIEVMKAERGYLLLLDKDKGGMVFRTARHMDGQNIAEEDLSLSRSIVRKVAEIGQPVLSTNALQDPRFRKSSSIFLHEIRSILCAPLTLKDKILGAIYIDNRVNSGVFNKSDLELMTALGNQAAIAIENAQLYERLQKTLQELQESNRHLQEVNRLKDEFLANISHELRTPLTSILGFSETMVSGRLGEINDRYQRCSKFILENGKNMLRLVEDLLDISLVQTNKIVLNYEQINVEKIIQECINSFSIEKDRKKITISYNVPPDISPVYADPNRFRRIITCLVDNAIKFNIYGGMIDILVKEDEENFIFSVSDSGIGISEENFELIFEKFRQVDGSATREYGGMGIGLTLVKELIELHNGRVGVESRLNVGSVFTFTLPKGEIINFREKAVRLNLS